MCAQILRQAQDERVEKSEKLSEICYNEVVMKKILLYASLCISTIFCTANIVDIVVPMAGLGTRLLPLTKSVSKSMMPLVDKPALQHVVEEALQSDIHNFLFVVNPDEQQIISHYFSRDLVLDAILQERKKMHFVAD